MTDTPPKKKFPPARISEIVLKSSRFAESQAWYEQVLEVKAFYERKGATQPTWAGALGIAFIRVHLEYPYTQVLAIFEIPTVVGTANNRAGEPGLHHMQFRHVSLEHLIDRYEALRDFGITPVRAFNHGPATSLYYADPDGNSVEMSATNFLEAGDYLAFMKSETYARNVSGIEVDPATFAARFRSGVPQPELVRID